MRYFIIDNFIDNELCKKLMDAYSITNSSKNRKEIHGGREFLSSTTLEFYNLLKKSKDWKNLENKINSSEFLELCIKKLDLKEKKFSLVNFFKCENLTNIQKLYKELSWTVSRFVSKKNLIIYFIIRVYRDILRKIKFSRLFYPSKDAVELLFDYSIAVNGYSRKIHRDSDSRLVVFILYLNTPSKTDTHEGGDFDIYKLVDGDENTGYPDKKNCEKIKSIKPESGKLVVFLNENDSFHGVEEMRNHSESRHFIYGGFTLLNKKNPHITNKSSVTTEFHLYD